MSEQADIKNLPDTVKTLIRSHGEGRIRNQSFSVSTKSKRVKLDLVDHRMLRMRTDADKVAKHADTKRMNHEAPYQMLARIDRKLIELGVKLIKAIRLGRDTTALDALILRCRYYKHVQTVRLNELNEAAIVREGAKAKIELPSNEVPVFERPIMSTSIGRTYKVKTRVLKDRITKHGPAEPGKVAIPKRSKPRKSKAKAKRGSGSY